MSDRVKGLAVIAFALAAAVISTLSVNGLPFVGGGHRLSVSLPAEAPLLKAGDEVRIGGQRVGTVKGIEPGRAKLELDRDVTSTERRSSPRPEGETPFLHARVRLRGMAGAVYVELTAGPPASEASVDIPHVVETFDTATRDALARTLRGAGGLAGHGEQLNNALRTTPDALTSTTPLLRASRDVATLVAPADRVARALAAGDLGALAEAANATSEPLAGQADALGASIDAMPGLENRIADVLPIADPVLEDATAAVRELEPAIAALGRALPAARGLEQDSENFADAASLLKTARPVLERARTVVARDVRWAAATLRPISRSAGVLARAIVPYAYELVDAPLGFDRWGGFKYDEGQGKGHKAVRFTMIFTCQTGRDPYPAPGAAIKERERCQP